MLFNFQVFKQFLSHCFLFLVLLYYVQEHSQYNSKPFKFSCLFCERDIVYLGDAPQNNRMDILSLLGESSYKCQLDTMV